MNAFLEWFTDTVPESLFLALFGVYLAALWAIGLRDAAQSVHLKRFEIERFILLGLAISHSVMLFIK